MATVILLFIIETFLTLALMLAVLVYSFWLMAVAEADPDLLPSGAGTHPIFASANIGCLSRENHLSLAAFLDVYRWQCIAIQETKLGKTNAANITEQELPIPQYEFFRCDRRTRMQGGGVGLYVASSLHPSLVRPLSTAPLELVAAELKFRNGIKVTCASVY